jgi:hypothetical protein
MPAKRRSKVTLTGKFRIGSTGMLNASHVAAGMCGELADESACIDFFDDENKAFAHAHFSADTALKLGSQLIAIGTELMRKNGKAGTA